MDRREEGHQPAGLAPSSHFIRASQSELAVHLFLSSASRDMFQDVVCARPPETWHRYA